MAATAASATALRPPLTRAPVKHELQWKKKCPTNLLPVPSLPSAGRRSGAVRAQAFFNPLDDPIFKEALKEPVAFMGGVFAGLLRLDLKEEPLKDWIAKTAEAAGTTVEELTGDLEPDEDSPQEIEIE